MAMYDGGFDSETMLRKSELRERAKEAERAAWAALSRYKFWMFGYHAANWVNINRLGKLGLSNPFKILVKTAQERGENAELRD